MVCYTAPQVKRHLGLEQPGELPQSVYRFLIAFGHCGGVLLGLASFHNVGQQLSRWWWWVPSVPVYPHIYVIKVSIA
jgi:hypothetical protein